METDGANKVGLLPYVAGTLIIVACAYLQYVVRLDFVSNILIVYGLPLVAVGVIWGRGIARGALKNNATALEYGVSFYGVSTAAAILASILIVSLLLAFDPGAVDTLNQPNPVLNVPQNIAILFIFISLLVTGPAEEILFRGFVFGGLLSLTGRKYWFTVAVAASLVFAAVHAYYGITYGIASVIPFVELILFGVAMAATYYFSGGNLLIPAAIHGLYDATGFIGVAFSFEYGAVLRYGMLSIGLLVAAYLFVRRRVLTPRLERAVSSS